MKKIIRLNESDLVRIVKRVISEQTTGSYSIEKIYDLPGKTIDEINKMIKSNRVVGSGGRVVSDEPNLLSYSKTLRVDNPELKKSQLMPLAFACMKGTYQFDLTFLIKDAKIKMIIDNFSPKELTNTNAGGACPSYYQDFGVVGLNPPSTSKLSADGATWKQMVQIIDGNLLPYFDEIIEGFSGSAGPDPYDF
jgi:hypothetical protein